MTVSVCYVTMCATNAVLGGYCRSDEQGDSVKLSEIECSAHMPLPSDEMFQIASDPARLNQWIPSEIAPRGETRGGSTAAAGASGLRLAPGQNRVEWTIGKDGGESWLEIRPAGEESDVTIHISMPHAQERHAEMEQQLQEALNRLEQEANKGFGY